jgi:hypothetical protein
VEGVGGSRKGGSCQTRRPTTLETLNRSDHSPKRAIHDAEAVSKTEAAFLIFKFQSGGFGQLAVVVLSVRDAIVYLTPLNRRNKSHGKEGISLAMEVENQSLATVNLLHDWADMVIENVRTQSDDRLVELARDAQDLEKAAFRVRGACGAELKRRILERQNENPNDRDRPAVSKQMNELATRIGVAPKTLADDTRIYETFGDRLDHGESLDREHYRISLSAPNPDAALDLARDNRNENPGYSTREFRNDVRKLQAIESGPAKSSPTGSTVKIGAESVEMLDKLRTISIYRDMSDGEIVAMALSELITQSVLS